MKGCVGIDVTITAKIQVYPTNEQKQMLLETVAQVKKALNHVSQYVYDNDCLNQKAINENTYYLLRELYGLRSQMAQSCMKTVIARYKTHKTNRHERTLVRFTSGEYALVFNRDYSIKDGIASVNSVRGRLKMPIETKGMEHYFDGSYKFGTAQLVCKYQKIFLHIPVTKEYTATTPFSINKIVGIDLGINFLATTYDSDGKTIFFSGKKLKSQRAHYKYLRKSLQETNTKSAKRKIKSIGSRENRYCTDVNHQITKALVERHKENTLYVLEDLSSVRTATEKVFIKNRYISVSWAFYQFRQFLEYKASLTNSMVIVVPPHYTSQTCPKCGHTEKANRNKKLHLFCCKNCEYTSNDDRIGAMNLFRKGLLYIEKSTKEVTE